jgi:hypothetical protein
VTDFPTSPNPRLSCILFTPSPKNTLSFNQVSRHSKLKMTMVRTAFELWVQSFRGEQQQEMADSAHRVQAVIRMAEQERDRRVRIALVYYRLRSTKEIYDIVFSRKLDLLKLGKDREGCCTCTETLSCAGRNGGYIPVARQGDQLFAIGLQLVLGWPYEAVVRRIERSTARPLALTFCTSRAVMALQTDRDFGIVVQVCSGLESKVDRLERKYERMLARQDQHFQAQEQRFREQEEKISSLRHQLSRTAQDTSNQIRVVARRPSLVSPTQLANSPRTPPASPSFVPSTPSPRAEASFVIGTPPASMVDRPESSFILSTPDVSSFNGRDTYDDMDDDDDERAESTRGWSPPPTTRLRSRSRSAPDLRQVLTHELTAACARAAVREAN